MQIEFQTKHFGCIRDYKQLQRHLKQSSGFFVTKHRRFSEGLSINYIDQVLMIFKILTSSWIVEHSKIRKFVCIVDFDQTPSYSQIDTFL